MLRMRVAARRLHSYAAAVSASADVSLDGMLRPAPLLRQIDSAFWCSGFGGHFIDEQDARGDAFCVAQALRVAPNARKQAGILGVREVGTAHLDPGLRVLSWLSSVGDSSANFCAAMAGGDGTFFASATRKYVRVGASGRPTSWTASQRARLEEAREADREATALVCGGMPAALHPLPPIERLATPPADELSPVFRTLALPHNMGSGGHLDHATLFEWAYDAFVLTRGGGKEDTSRALAGSIGYVGQAACGDEVEVRATASEGGDALILIGRVADGKALAVARFGHLAAAES